MNVRVGGIIIKDKQVLVIRHDYLDESLWHIPGGNVNEGENLRNALTRELAEELALASSIGPLLLVCDSLRHDDMQVLHLLFLVSGVVDEPILQKTSSSGTAVEWVTIEELFTKKTYPPNIVSSIADFLKSGLAYHRTDYLGRC